MEKLLQKAKHLVDVKKDDGFAAIHLSSLNGYKAVTKILIIKGHSDINLKNDRLQTPLHLAASQVSSPRPPYRSHLRYLILISLNSQKRYSVVELLVKLGADVNAVDENGDTPLHLALTNKKSQTPAVDFDPEEAPSIFGVSMRTFLKISTYLESSTPHFDLKRKKFIFQIFNKLKTANNNSENLLLVAMICYLLQNGCNISRTNKNGLSCLNLIKKSQLIDILKDIPDLLPRLESRYVTSPLSSAFSIESPQSHFPPSQLRRRRLIGFTNWRIQRWNGNPSDTLEQRRRRRRRSRSRWSIAFRTCRMSNLLRISRRQRHLGAMQA